MNATPVYCPPIMRAAIVRSYSDQLVKENRAKRPRRISFEAAMRLRADWIAGESTRDLAARIFDGRLDSATELVSGVSYTSCTVEECIGHDDLMAAFWRALDACTFAPVGSEAASYVLPLVQFAAGDYSLPAAGELQLAETREKAKEVPALERSAKSVGDDRPRGRLGFKLSPHVTWASVIGVVPGGPADLAGVRITHEIKSVNGKRAKSREEVVSFLGAVREGDTVELGLSYDDGDETIHTLVADKRGLKESS